MNAEPAIAPSTRSRGRTLVLVIATGLCIALCFLLISPFLPALAWAVALAVLFAPLQRWLESRLRHPNLATTVSVLMIVLMVIVPATFVVQQVVMQAASGSKLIENKIESGEWRRAIESQPRLAPLADKIDKAIDLPDTVKSLTNWLSGMAASVVRGSVFQLVSFGLVFYLLYFLLRDRSIILDAIRDLSPLSELETEHLLERVGDTLHATIYGTLAVASMQGTLGGLMFWWLGLPAPFLWGVVMGLFAIVPVLGAFVVWIPAALFLMIEGSWGKALILTMWGGLVVGTIDNLLRPVLVGKRLKQHTLLAFLSVVGGLVVFGASGLIIGPVLLTITLVLLETWTKEHESPRPIQQETDALDRLENEGGSSAVS